MTKAFSLPLRFLLATGLLTPFFSLPPSGIAQDAPIPAPLKGKVLFLGDSITHAGHTISMGETALLAEGLDPASFELINLVFSQA